MNCKSNATFNWAILIVIAFAGCRTQYQPANWKDVSNEVNEFAENAKTSGTDEAAIDLERFGPLTPWSQGGPLPIRGGISANRKTNQDRLSNGSSSSISTLPSRSIPMKMSTLPSRDLNEGRAGRMTTLPGSRLPGSRVPSNRNRVPGSRGTTLPDRTN